MTENIKEKFLAQANQFEPIMTAVANSSKQETETDTEVALMLYEQIDSKEKSELTNNIDNLEKVYDVVQFQVEAMCEYIRSVLGPIVQHLESEASSEDEDLLPMLMFVQDKAVKLHNQLDFFFGNFEEEDLKKGFSIARRSAQAMKYNKSEQKEQAVAFVRLLRSRTMSYLVNVTELHNWLHGLMDLVDGELQTQGLQGFAAESAD